VAGIPKTIDNDLDYIDHSFGFSSAVEAAQVAIRSAKIEAVCNKPNGIGVVKLMGRSAGFIAAHATMSSSDVDLCLIPEVPIVLEGRDGCLPHLRRRVREQGYAVVVVAEGAGEDVLGISAEVDAGGNRKLPPVGKFMKDQIVEYYKKHGDEATVKYIDPSYTVRSVPANAADSLCKSSHRNRNMENARTYMTHLTCSFVFRLHAAGPKCCSWGHGGLYWFQCWIVQQSNGLFAHSRIGRHVAP